MGCSDEHGALHSVELMKVLVIMWEMILIMDTAEQFRKVEKVDLFGHSEAPKKNSDKV